MSSAAGANIAIGTLVIAYRPPPILASAGRQRLLTGS
jgi:hypothetical protein